MEKQNLNTNINTKWHKKKFTHTFFERKIWSEILNAQKNNNEIF